MNDLEKVENFCSDIGSTELYPISLKNLKGISFETRNTLLKVIEEIQQKQN